MNQRSYTKRGLLLLSLGLVSGCASAYRATNTSDDISSGASVEMVVLNQTQNAVRVYLIWEDRGGAWDKPVETAAQPNPGRRDGDVHRAPEVAEDLAGRRAGAAGEFGRPTQSPIRIFDTDAPYMRSR